MAVGWKRETASNRVGFGGAVDRGVRLRTVWGPPNAWFAQLEGWYYPPPMESGTTEEEQVSGEVSSVFERLFVVTISVPGRQGEVDGPPGNKLGCAWDPDGPALGQSQHSM